MRGPVTCADLCDRHTGMGNAQNLAPATPPDVLGAAARRARAATGLPPQPPVSHLTQRRVPSTVVWTATHGASPVGTSGHFRGRHSLPSEDGT